MTLFSLSCMFCIVRMWLLPMWTTYRISPRCTHPHAIPYIWPPFFSWTDANKLYIKMPSCYLLFGASYPSLKYFNGFVRKSLACLAVDTLYPCRSVLWIQIGTQRTSHVIVFCVSCDCLSYGHFKTHTRTNELLTKLEII